MKIALIQQHASRDQEDNLHRGEEAFRRAAQQGAQLIAFAELGLSYFWPQYHVSPELLQKAEPIPGPTTEMFISLAKSAGLLPSLTYLREMDLERMMRLPLLMEMAVSWGW